MTRGSQLPRFLRVAQVSRYWNRYRLVLVTNYRDFVLLGEDACRANPTPLETLTTRG